MANGRDDFPAVTGPLHVQLAVEAFRVCNRVNVLRGPFGFLHLPAILFEFALEALALFAFVQNGGHGYVSGRGLYVPANRLNRGCRLAFLSGRWGRRLGACRRRGRNFRRGLRVFCGRETSLLVP